MHFKKDALNRVAPRKPQASQKKNNRPARKKNSNNSGRRTLDRAQHQAGVFPVVGYKLTNILVI